MKSYIFKKLPLTLIVSIITVVIGLFYFGLIDQIWFSINNSLSKKSNYENCKMEKGRDCLWLMEAHYIDDEREYLHLLFYISLEEYLTGYKKDSYKQVLFYANAIAEPSKSKDKFKMYQKIGNLMCQTDKNLSQNMKICDKGVFTNKSVYELLYH